jgi:hypothetical protein
MARHASTLIETCDRALREKGLEGTGLGVCLHGDPCELLDLYHRGGEWGRRRNFVNRSVILLREYNAPPKATAGSVAA